MKVSRAPAADPDLDRRTWGRSIAADASGTLGIGVIGYGYWGPNLVRNFAEAPGTSVVAVCDLRPDRLQEIGSRYPAVTTTTDHRELLRNPAVDVIVVATPVGTHFELACQALRAGKHVFVEKPMASTVEECKRLIELAEHHDLTLMVDHTFVYTSAVQRIKELVDGGQLGRLYYWDSVRVNLGLFQPDISVLADLAVHDLAIMDYVIDARPVAVAATGVAHVPGRLENTAYVTCFFEQDLLAHFHVNWLAPVKVRRTLIGGDQRMIVYDDIEPSEKVKVYDSGITLDVGDRGRYEMMVGYRAGDMWAPRLSVTEALRVEVEHFADCVRNGRRPLTDGLAGLRTVAILEAAARSLAERGRPIELDWGDLDEDPAVRSRGAVPEAEATA
jgi:predicted dehydrogenase